MLACLLRLSKFFEEVELVLHFEGEFARSGAILLVWMFGGAYPTLLCLGTVVGVVGVGLLAARDECGSEFALRRECAENLAVCAEEVRGACE